MTGPKLTQLFEAARRYLEQGNMEAVNRCLERVFRVATGHARAQGAPLLLRSALESGIALRFRPRTVEPSVFGGWTWRRRQASPQLESRVKQRSEDVEFEKTLRDYKITIITARRDGHCDLTATLSPKPQEILDLVLHTIEDGRRVYGRRINSCEFVLENVTIGLYILEIQALLGDGEYNSVLQVTVQIDGG